MARLEVTDHGGAITFPCAAGTLDQQIVVSREVEFEVTGTMVAGPLAAPPRPVRYEGRVEKNQMTLSIMYTDTSEDFGTYALTKGLDSGVAYICVC